MFEAPPPGQNIKEPNNNKNSNSQSDKMILNDSTPPLFSQLIGVTGTCSARQYLTVFSPPSANEPMKSQNVDQVDNIVDLFLNQLLFLITVLRHIDKAPTIVIYAGSFRPTKVNILKKNALYASRVNELKCVSSGSRPPALITWWKGNQKLTNSRESVSENKTVITSTLKLTPTSLDNGKYLTCRAENPLIPNSAIESGFRLEIFYSPEMKLEVAGSINLQDIHEGSEILFNCNVYSNPSPEWIGWVYNDRDLNNDPKQGIIISNQSLVIQSISRKHNGVYRCAASNIEGREQSNAVLITVKHVPMCKSGQRKHYNIAKHTSGKIVCEVDADPSEVSFRWWHNMSAYEPIDLTDFVIDKTMSIASYTPRSKLDYGYLYCSAENKVGLQKTPCAFKINPAEPPERLKQCVVLNETSNSVDVQCNYGYNGGLKTHIILEIYKLETKTLLNNITVKGKYIKVTNLPPSTSLLFAFSAANSKGRSSAITLEAHTAKGVAKRTNVDQIIIKLLESSAEEEFIKELICDPPQQNESKYTEEMNDSNDRQSPDILPMNRNCISVYTKEEEDNSGGFEDIGENNTDKASLVQRKNNYLNDKNEEASGVLYAELSLSNSNTSPDRNEINRREAPTEYAQLDFVKMNNKNNDCSSKKDNKHKEASSSCLSPLMSTKKRESFV
ncbi:Cell adhesion molecule 1 [Nymphon striatum]|nr:Cell adhesion molecule 1 [Nymphon striatum]